MKPIDNFQGEILSLNNAKKFLNENQYANFKKISDSSKIELLKEVLEKPIDNWNEVTELYFRSKWANLFNTLYCNKKICLLEIASGDADMIPQTLSISNPDSYYIAANMNKILNESLIRKTKELNINLKLIDDDASNIREHIENDKVDIIAFQHGVNDVLQAMLCANNEIDTINCQWLDLLPQMIELVKKEVENNTFEETLKKNFIRFINEIAYTLKKDGIIAINHYMFDLDLKLGYPLNIFENLIDIIREWLKEDHNFEEISFENFDNHWWIFLKKKI
ncbi:hypothetical protein FHH43_09700 [Clostridium perfringens]|nr:hypothetical protein [Clostridium perfringens]